MANCVHVLRREYAFMQYHMYQTELLNARVELGASRFRLPESHVNSMLENIAGLEKKVQFWKRSWNYWQGS